MLKKLILTCAILGAVNGANAASYIVVAAPFHNAVKAPAITLQLSTANLPASVQNAVYPGFDFNTVLQASGDSAFLSSGVSWRVSTGALPPGLVLNANGTLTGTPTTGGSYSFSVQATYRGVSAEQAYQVGVLSDLTTQGTSFASSYGSYAFKAFDHNDGTAWQSMYDAGEIIGRQYPTARYFDYVTIRMTHYRQTALEVYSGGSWVRIATLASMSGTTTVSVGMFGTQIRLRSLASDNVVPMSVATFDLMGI